MSFIDKFEEEVSRINFVSSSIKFARLVNIVVVSVILLEPSINKPVRRTFEQKKKFSSVCCSSLIMLDQI